MASTSRKSIGVVVIALAAFATATASADQIDYQATQFGYQSMFFTDESEEKNLELAEALLTINNDLGIDFTDPNSHDALGEILAGHGLQNFRLIFDRLATHWTAQLLPVTDGDWRMPGIDRPLERYQWKHQPGYGPPHVRNGFGRSASPQKTPEPEGPPPLTTTAIPEPATFALFALGGLMMLRRHPRRSA